MADNLLGGCSTWRINIRLCQGWGHFTNTFFSNHFSFFHSWRYINLKIKLWPKLWKYLYLKLIVKGFQSLYHAQLDLDIFCKVNSINRDCIRKTMAGWQCNPQGRRGVSNFNGEGGHYVTLLYWNFIFLLGTVKDFIGFLFSLYFCCFTYFVSTEIGKGKTVS